MGEEDSIKYISRRDFLKTAGIVAGHLAFPVAERGSGRKEVLGVNRLTEWAPKMSDLLEWRYSAGRITRENEDFGFVVALTESRIPGNAFHELLVQRQDFLGDREFKAETYEGRLDYDFGTGTYVFKNSDEKEMARWQWDDQEKQYELMVSTDELSLDDLVFKPKGGLIAEGGDGEIVVGRVGDMRIRSDYHADWVGIFEGDDEVGTARVDMQGLYPESKAATKITEGLKQWFFGKKKVKNVGEKSEAFQGQDYDHHWFALAVELEDGMPVWLSAWRIEDEEGPLWALTVAVGDGKDWELYSYTDEDKDYLDLDTRVVETQELPKGVDGSARAGSSWRVVSKTTSGEELVDFSVEVPKGQFITKARVGEVASQVWMEEAIGKQAEGMIFGKKIKEVKLVAVESTAERYLQYLALSMKNSSDK